MQYKIEVMTKYFLAIFFLSAILFLHACTPKVDDKAQEQALRDSIMQVHDSIMPWMEQITNLKEQIEALARDSTSDSVTSSLAIVLTGELVNGETQMWDWMHQWLDPDSTVSHEEVMQYYRGQMLQIDSLADLMSSVMEKAETFLSPNDDEKE